MSVEAFGLLLGIAIVCGSVGQALAGYSTGGFWVRTGVAFIGAVLGRWLVNSFRLPRSYTVTVGDTDFPLVWSVAGAALLVAVLGALWGRKTG